MVDHSTSSSASDGKKLWQEWHVRGATLTSLMLQMLLLLLATFRKRTSNPVLQYLVSCVYQGSYVVAQATFTLIVGARWFAMYKMPFGLWAAVMLLHLAGQERLTAYSLDDNNDWLSSFLGVFWLYFVHVFVVEQKDLLPWSTKVMLFLGFIRLCWRTIRLRLGTLEMSGLDPFLDPHSPSINDSHQPELNARGGVEEKSTPAMDGWQILLEGHLLLRDSLRLLAGNKKGPVKGHKRRLSLSQLFKSLKDPKDAIRIVEVELNFLYESFHTEGTIRKRLDDNFAILYAVIRCFEPLLCILTVLFFTDSYQREEYSGSDFKITFFLLWGTVILEFLAYLMTVFSDWTIVALKKDIGRMRSPGKILLSFLPHRQLWWSSDRDQSPTMVGAARVLCRRWSETISKFSFLVYSIKQSQGTPFDYIRPEVFTGVASSIRSFKFVSSQWYTDKLGLFVFEELRNRQAELIVFLKDCRYSFRKSVLSLHFTTELLYYSHQIQQLDKKDKALHENSAKRERRDQLREHSKLISDYMAYLLFMKPMFMYRLGENPLKESDDARASVRQVMGQIPLTSTNFEEFLAVFCNEMLNRGLSSSDENRFMLHDVTREMTQDETSSIDRWTKISGMWVETLLYAASESDPLNHVRELCHGGELVTLVWLLAFHLGFFERENINGSNQV